MKGGERLMLKNGIIALATLTLSFLVAAGIVYG